MTTKQLLERIETITTLAGCPMRDEAAGRVLTMMLGRGTYVPGSTEINLASLWEAVDAVGRLEKACTALQAHMQVCSIQTVDCGECELLTMAVEAAHGEDQP
jgi:hypothetical protein